MALWPLEPGDLNVATLSLTYFAGTLGIEGLPKSSPDAAALQRELPECLWDQRSASFRTPAKCYAQLLRTLKALRLEYDDLAGTDLALHVVADYVTPNRPYQQEALVAWLDQQSCGVVVLPTGSGKTRVALLAIESSGQKTLVIAPTIDLVAQWRNVLQACIHGPIGMVGGGTYELEAVTVTTYDSAHIHAEHWGNRFGLLIFDECHHLPSPGYSQIAQLNLAPKRLGLSATPERADGAHGQLDQLIGPVVYRKEIVDLEGDFLAPYETERVYVELSDSEQNAYRQARETYLGFLRAQGIRIAHPAGWGRFMRAATQSEAGRAAWLAYRTQKALALGANAKRLCVQELLQRHALDKTLVFTNDNAMAYDIAKHLLIPVITHQTQLRERSHILAGLADGTYHAVVTSRVLNEGIDLPEVNIAIVVSGTGTVREHVQRLGRVLRPSPNKSARLYELVTRQTHETRTSERRRAHVAYS